MSSHARHNDARRYQEAFGGSHAQALRQVREQLPPAREASRALTAAVCDGQEVPPVLLVAQADLARWAIKHLNEVIALGQQLPHNLCEWSRLSSYAMTDAHAYTQMMAGTNGAVFQMLGWDDDLIRRHLQVCDADRFVTSDAVAHAAGLFGQPVPPGVDLTSWWTIGGQYAARDVTERAAGTPADQRRGR